MKWSGCCSVPRRPVTSNRERHTTWPLLLQGYVARLGPAGMEPAGFCALLPYPDDQAAELAGLFTITRTKGRVGGRLVEALVQEAHRRGLTYVFACTTQAGAQRLFVRQGFQHVAPRPSLRKNGTAMIRSGVPRSLSTDVISHPTPLCRACKTRCGRGSRSIIRMAQIRHRCVPQKRQKAPGRPGSLPAFPLPVYT